MYYTKWVVCVFLLLNVSMGHGAQVGNTADYVIVGVGTAGAVLAQRLSDDKKTSVIALHSGSNFTNSFIVKYSKNTVFSVLASLLGSSPPFDPASLNLPLDVQQELEDLIQLTYTSANPLYETGSSIPQPNADDQELLWVIPLPLGGATSINAGAWCRGTNQVFSQWETIAGPNWSVNRILGVYKELERFYGKTTNPHARGHHGRIKIQQDSPSKLSKIFNQAVTSATGFPFILDYNDPNTPIGVSQLQLTHHGEDGFYRQSSVTSFLNDHVMKSDGSGVGKRKLQVLFNSAAVRTIWNGTTATGVEFVQNGVTKTVYATKGVIVCAGLRSSAFLMNSGVGPAGVITPLGIPLIYDNPNVGQGLADQPHVIMVFSSNPKDSGAGSNSVFSQISWLPAPGGDPTVRQLRFTTLDVVPGVTLALLDLCQPQSRGTITINSADPLAPPVIDFGILSNPDDLSLLVSGFQTYIADINTQLQTINPEYQLIYPDPAILSDTALLTAFVQEEIGPTMHFQSHCRMAPLSQGGVVDSTGRVYGVQNLFVADNSIVPQCMDGSPMATGYLIAENIAELLGY